MQNREKPKTRSPLQVGLLVVGGSILAGSLLIGLILLTPVVVYYLSLRVATAEYEAVASAASEQPNAEYMPPVIYDVKLANRERDYRLKSSVAFGLAAGDDTAAEAIRFRQKQIDNVIKLILMGKTTDDLAPVQGRLELEEEIRASVNYLIGGDSIIALKVEVIEIR